MSNRSTRLAVSVVIPTHNPRADYLAQVVDALKQQTLSPEQWELLVVDNASKEMLAGRLDLSWHPHARIVREERLGLTFARLRGIAEARGELIAWVDDDNVLAPDYLSCAANAFELYPQLAAAGGKSLPQYEVTPPDWYNKDLVPLGIRDLGEREALMRWCPAAPREYPSTAPIGAGMVTRKPALEKWSKAVQSDPRRLRLGRTGNSLASGEDNDINLTLLHDGWDLAYLPQLRLTHLIPERRMTIDYQRRMARDSMKSFILMLDQHGIRPWPAMPKWTLPLRVANDWWRVKPWRGPEQSLRFWGHVGMYEGRAALPAEPAAAAVDR